MQQTHATPARTGGRPVPAKSPWQRSSRWVRNRLKTPASDGVAPHPGPAKEVLLAPEGTRDVVFWMADEVVLALLLTMVAVVLNHLMVRSGARSAFENEIARQRVVHISEVWSSLYESEVVARKLLKSAREVAGDQGGYATELRKLLIPLQKESEHKARCAQQMIDANRFWLGRTLYYRMRAFQNAQMQMIAALGSANPPAFRASEARLEKARMSVIDFIDNPP